MNKLFFLKSLSRSVHDEEQHGNHHENETKIADGTPTSLTVWRKSLIVNCNGFTVINSHGDLAYRVDNYIHRPSELVLMDGSGKSILTMHRSKKLGLGDAWVVYEGEKDKSSSSTAKKKPIWSVKKNMSILKGNGSVLAQVYRSGSMIEKRNGSYSYVIEGCYRNRSCKIMEGSRKVVAEIKRKDSTMGGVSFGLEVFVLVVQPGFDPGLAMALVLLLDQMFS